LNLESLPENDLAWRGLAAMALGDSYVVSGEMNPAKNAYSEAIRISKNSGNVYSTLFPSCKLGIILEYLGKLHQAQELYRELMTLVDESGLSQSVMTGLLYALWSEILCHWNDIDNAFQYVSRGVELSEHENDVANLAWIHNTFVKVLFAKRDLTRAKETILKLGKIAGESHVPPWIVTRTAAWKARIWLTEGNLDAVQQWIQEFKNVCPPLQPGIHRCHSLGLRLGPVARPQADPGYSGALLSAICSSLSRLAGGGCL
jgi:ATP/maltotriose-dependent transcriptional regulator MalT